jgi:hypothetical protein
MEEKKLIHKKVDSAVEVCNLINGKFNNEPINKEDILHIQYVNGVYTIFYWK